jgi:bifunctional DNase/RNase
MTQVAVTIEPVRVALLSHNRTVILKQKGAHNYLPFWVNESQADIIAAQLYESPNRDAELDLFLTENNGAGADVKGSVIHLDGDNFYVKVLLSQHSRDSELRCPIGIGIALACRAHAPVLVDEEVFSKAGICCPPTPREPRRKQSWWSRPFKSHNGGIAGCSLEVAGYDGTNIVCHFVDDMKMPSLQSC